MSTRTRHCDSSADYAHLARGGSRNQTREPPEWLYPGSAFTKLGLSCDPKSPPRAKNTSLLEARSDSQENLECEIAFEFACD